MNNKKSFLRKGVLVCLTVAISACEPQSDPATTPDVAVASLTPGSNLTPASLAAASELAARWSADSLSLRDGDPVGVWPDSSQNGNVAIARGTSRPTYRIIDGVPMVHFDGIDDFLTVGSAADWRFLKDGSEWTVFVLFRSAGRAPGTQYTLLDTDGDDSGFAVSYADRADARSNDAVRVSISGDSAANDLDLSGSNRSFPPGKWGIISANYWVAEGGWGGATLYVNGYRKALIEKWVRPDPTRGESELNIGQSSRGAFPVNGDIKEILIFRKTLSQQEHYEVVRGLARAVTPAVRIRTGLARNWLSPNPNGYQGFGIAFRIPTTGKLVAIQRQGLSHVSGSVGEIRQWESTDRGATWTNRLTYDSEFDDRNVGGGLATHTGTIVAFIARYDGTHFIDMRALRSVDGAQTFEDGGAPLPTNDCWGFSPYGPMVELPSGRLLQTFYGGNSTTNKVWVSESVDDGLTWTYKADIYAGPLRINETSAIWISGANDDTSTLIAVSRNDGGAGLLQFVSRDGGNTWTNQGLIPGGNKTDVSPWLHKLSDGTIVNAWHERSWFSFDIRMGPGSDVAASPANWGQVYGTYKAATQIYGDSGYPALLSATGWDDDLIQVFYDRVPGGNANLLIAPISLP